MRTLPRYSDEFKSDAVALLKKRPDEPLAQVAEDIGVSAWTLRYWYNQDRVAKKTKKQGNKVLLKVPAETAEERVKRLERDNERLRKENEALKMDREILKKAASFPVAALCRLLGVSRQGYYAFAKRPQSARLKEEVELQERLRALHAESRGTYGSPRMVAALRDEGFRVGKRRVERALRALGLRGLQPRRWRATTKADPLHEAAPNTLDREFTATKPNERWVTDITYVWTQEGWCYLAAILDLYSRSVVGWALDTTLSTRLPLLALEKALTHRTPSAGLLHHSDRGCQYTSADYRQVLDDNGIVVSMSRKGNCWDNAVAESFFATLKNELVHTQAWTGRLELREAVFEYIEVFYNRRRLHSSLGYKTPARVEADHQLALAA